MFLWALLILAWAVAAQTLLPINSTSLLNTILQQQAAEVLVKQDEAALAWKNATLMMTYLNTAVALATQNVSLLFNQSSAAELSAVLNAGECVVKPYGVYITNATEIQLFVCCHLRKLRFPALLYILSAAYQVFHGAPVDADSDNTAATVQGLQTMQFLDRAGFTIAHCLDDTTAFAPEQATVRAVGAESVLSNLLEAYGAIQSGAVALAGCLESPSSGCLRLTPLELYIDVTPNFQYYTFDPEYQQTCGGAVLSAFDHAQHGGVCTPIPHS